MCTRVVWIARYSLSNSSLCLDQHLAADSSGRPTVPTTTVWLIPCHYQLKQLWYLEDLGGNTFWVRNSGTGWCLSAPENSGSQGVHGGVRQRRPQADLGVVAHRAPYGTWPCSVPKRAACTSRPSAS
ncbi:RICIN domain-containing protein [Micromonospora sp. CPCC 205371]|nr:RICIN domain-containing protein [Micromonospora sp. CPCC 205371]